MLGSWPDDGRGEQRLIFGSVGIARQKDEKRTGLNSKIGRNLKYCLDLNTLIVYTVQ